MTSLRAQLSAAVFADDYLSRAASYTPPGGSPVAVRARVSAPDGELGVDVSGGVIRVKARAALITVRSTDVATPVVGGQFAVTGEGGTVEIFEITDGPMRMDGGRTLWTCDCKVVT